MQGAGNVQDIILEQYGLNAFSCYSRTSKRKGRTKTWLNCRPWLTATLKPEERKRKSWLPSRRGLWVPVLYFSVLDWEIICRWEAETAVRLWQKAVLSCTEVTAQVIIKWLLPHLSPLLTPCFISENCTRDPSACPRRKESGFHSVKQSSW